MAYPSGGHLQHILRENDDDTFEENGSTGQRSPGEPFKDLDQQQTTPEIENVI